jgi:iron complex outermembrane receptor protein
MNSLKFDRQVMARALLSALAVSLSGVAQSVVAQQSTGGLEEVIVTAQKREQNLQDVPVAVTALTQETLEVNTVVDVSDLSGLAPNLTVRPAVGGTNLPAFNMRGITSYGIVPGSDKQISTYLDGVYIGSPRGGIFTLPDIQRLEVLRGPQGTLFGRNATGGAISVVTRDPAGELGFRQQLSVGNRDYLQSQTTVDTPTWGPFSAYITYQAEEQDGDIDNLGHNTTWDRTAWGRGFEGSPKTLGEVDNESVFLAAMMELDTVAATYKFDYGTDKGSPQGTAIVSGFCPTCLNQPGFDQLINILTAANADLVGGESTKRPNSVNNAWTGNRDQEILGHNLTVDWEINDSLNLKNILAYRKTTQELLPADISGTSGWVWGPVGAAIPAGPPLFGPFAADDPFCYVCSYTSIDSDQWSNEIQLNYSSDLMNITTGALYYDSKDDVDGNTFTFAGYPDNVVPALTRNMTTNKAESYAVYSQGEIHLTDTIDLLGGLRYTNDDKSGGIFGTLGEEVIRDSSFDYSDDKMSYLAGTSYTPNDDLMLYAKYSTAYVSGGSVAAFTFDPEEAESWEVGAKTDFLEKRLRTNLALFDVTYDSLQGAQSGTNVPGADGIGTLIVESGDLEAKGVELEVSALPTDGLVLGATLGYQDVKFTSISDLYAVVNGAAGPDAYPGSSLSPTLAPEWSGNLSANYTTAPLFDEAYLAFGVTGIWHDEIRFEPNSAKAAQTPFGVAEFTPEAWMWNARASLKEIRITDGWTGEISLWGRNLTDDDHMTFAVNFGAMVGANFVEERSYGIDFIARFN